MLKFIKNLLRQEEKKALHTGFHDIPAWLEARKQAAIQELQATTEKEQAEIRSSIEQLSEVIRVLPAARFDEEIHPKLKSIAEKSLPQYAKSIMAALEKSLPDEPLEFYTAAAELLKICINSAHGQGKYLTAAFPEEMKAITACVATIGRGINAMNEPVSAYRTEMARITEALKIHAALADIDEDEGKSQQKEDRINRRILEINNRISDCERSVAELENKRTEQELASQEQKIIQMKKDRDQIVHRYAALSMAASHVLRKAEKVAHRQHKPADERAIATAMGILSDHTVPASADLVAALDAAYVPARRMIDAGEVVLKNKEERALFFSREKFSDEIRALCARYAEQAARCNAEEQAFCSHPVITRHAELTKELHQLFETLAKEKQAGSELMQWKSELIKKIPGLRQQLKSIMEVMSGGDVQILYPDNSRLSP